MPLEQHLPAPFVCAMHFSSAVLSVLLHSLLLPGMFGNGRSPLGLRCVGWGAQIALGGLQFVSFKSIFLRCLLSHLPPQSGAQVSDPISLFRAQGLHFSCAYDLGSLWGRTFTGQGDGELPAFAAWKRTQPSHRDLALVLGHISMLLSRQLEWKPSWRLLLS